MKKLLQWKKHHLEPAATWYLLSQGIAIGSVYWAHLHYPEALPLTLGIVFCLLAMPLIVAAFARAFYRPVHNATYFGWINSYRLTGQSLTYMLARVVPVFKINLSDISSIQAWPGLGQYARGGTSGRNGILWFFDNQTWWWPDPFLLSFKNSMRIQAPKCEYAVHCESGWTIVILCPQEFATKIWRTVKNVRSLNGTVNVGGAKSHNDSQEKEIIQHEPPEGRGEAPRP